LLTIGVLIVVDGRKALPVDVELIRIALLYNSSSVAFIDLKLVGEIRKRPTPFKDSMVVDFQKLVASEQGRLKHYITLLSDIIVADDQSPGMLCL